MNNNGKKTIFTIRRMQMIVNLQMQYNENVSIVSTFFLSISFVQSVFPDANPAVVCMLTKIHLHFTTSIVNSKRKKKINDNNKPRLRSFHLFLRRSVWGDEDTTNYSSISMMLKPCLLCSNFFCKHCIVCLPIDVVKQDND